MSSPVELASFVDIQKTIQLSSAVGKPCEECSAEQSPEFLFSGPEDVGAQVSHYIEAHGYQLLHIGQQTGRDQAGHPWQTTVAIVGKPREIYQRYT